MGLGERQRGVPDVKREGDGRGLLGPGTTGATGRNCQRTANFIGRSTARLLSAGAEEASGLLSFAKPA
jgi:hypothetical protein